MLMKRPLLFGAMGLAALCANAQTTVETAQEVTEGNNSYVQAEASNATSTLPMLTSYFTSTRTLTVASCPLLTAHQAMSSLVSTRIMAIP